MWWHSPRATVSRFAPLATVLALAGLLGGCFEPLYGEKTLAGGPGLSQRLRAVAIEPIRAPSGTPNARIAVELQNDLNYDFTGGVGQTGKTHQLVMTLTTQNQAGDRRHHHGAAGRAAVRHQRELHADRNRHRQTGGDRLGLLARVL
jgi:hypothetical protein